MLFLGAIGIIFAIGVGITLSEDIDDFIIVFLFWLLYIVTIATFINIILVVNYYLTMRNKTGVQGIPGPDGDQGDKGKSGVCDPGCRDSICEDGIISKLQTLLQEQVIKDKSADPLTIRFNNIYIKGKVKQMCSSKEFKQLVPYNGPQNLINYLNDIWTLWFNALYSAGGLAYFQNIAAETEFEWKTDNPFFEIKKYDVFYWGMGKQYRPNILEKCNPSNDGDTIYTGNNTNLKVAITNMYTQLNDSEKTGELEVSLWRAEQFTYKGTVYYPVGDIIISPIKEIGDELNDFDNNPYSGQYNDSVIVKRHVGDIKFSARSGPNRETIIVSGDVKGPVGYDMIWSTLFWIWRPIPPPGYVSLGDIVTIDDNKPATGDNAPIRCVKSDVAIQTPPNGNVLFTRNNIMVLAFNPNGTSIYNIDLYTAQTNCYNMFRAVLGNDPTNLPASDATGSFYYLDTTKFNAQDTIGVDLGQPSIDKDSNKVGNGYIPYPTREARYSILPYLNLKNNAILVHTASQIRIYATIITGAISNNYLLNTINSTDTTSCLNFDGNSMQIIGCDSSMSTQTFSINFTGAKPNECILQHNDTQNILCYVDAAFKLVDKDDSSHYNNELFIMQ